MLKMNTSELPLFRKGLNDFEAESLREVTFTQFAQKSEKAIVTLWILSTKILFLTAQPDGYHFIPSCQGCFKYRLSSFTFILHIHRQANYCSETFFWKSYEETLFNTFKTFAIISGCF